MSSQNAPEPRARRIMVIMIEMAGLTAVTAGVALVYIPAALVVGGLGLVLWAQGAAK